MHMCQMYKEQAEIIKAALDAASSLPNADSEKIAELYRKYSKVAYPPGSRGSSVEELIKKKMTGGRWKEIQEEFRNTQWVQ